jgi:hypothetical protein
MKIWKIFLFIVFVIVLIIGVFSRIAQSDQELYIELVDKILDLLSYLVINFVVVFYVFFSGTLAGFIWYLFLQIIDSKVDVHINFTKTQMIFITFLVAILFALGYTWFFRKSLELPDTWIRTIATESYFGWQPWSGEFGRSPVLWSIYGFFTFFIGFFLSPTIIEPIESILNSFGLVVRNR